GEHATSPTLLVDRELLPNIPCEDPAPLLGCPAIPDAPTLREPELSASSHRITHEPVRQRVSALVTGSPVTLPCADRRRHRRPRGVSTVNAPVRRVRPQPELPRHGQRR